MALVFKLKRISEIILILTISASLLLSIVRADIRLAPEFYDPLGPWKSSNFEPEDEVSRVVTIY